MSKLPVGIELKTFRDQKDGLVHVLAVHPQTGAEAYRAGTNEEELKEEVLLELEEILGPEIIPPRE